MYVRRWITAVLVTAIGHLTPAALAESPWPFVPADFEVPAVLETGQYRLRMLTVNDLVKDYDAVMSSAEHLQQDVFPGRRWPEGLTLEQDLVDLGWHQREFQRRTSFAFTVVERDESRVVGCVYIYPTRKVDHDARVMLWTRPPEQLPGLDEARLRSVVRAWLAEAWPFEHPIFPGADVSWEAWAALPEIDD